MELQLPQSPFLGLVLTSIIYGNNKNAMLTIVRNNNWLTTPKISVERGSCKMKEKSPKKLQFLQVANQRKIRCKFGIIQIYIVQNKLYLSFSIIFLCYPNQSIYYLKTFIYHVSRLQWSNRPD
jgi:hypothetical protein